jgi:hypothetical protein
MGGIGVYFPNFLSIDAGVNAGAGLEYSFNTRLSLDLGGRLHYMVRSQDIILQTMVGLIWRFQIIY